MQLHPWTLISLAATMSICLMAYNLLEMTNLQEQRDKRRISSLTFRKYKRRHYRFVWTLFVLCVVAVVYLNQFVDPTY